MELKRYEIPPGCKEISIEEYNERVVISFVKGEIHNITGEEELRPGVGDLAILYNEWMESKAIISNIVEIDVPRSSLDKKKFKSNSGNWYTDAIRFRNGSQYESIINYRDDSKE